MADLTFRVAAGPTGEVLTVEGDLDERTDFGKAPIARAATPLAIDLGGVRRINSCGVREWVNFIRQLSQSRPVRLLRCSMPIVEQLNMVFNFRGTASVDSFFAPYCCGECGTSKTVLLTPAEASAAPQLSLACEQCGGTCVFDELPERYFAFLVETNA